MSKASDDTTDEGSGSPKAKRGFAAMSPEKRCAIARKGGQAVQQKGTAHQFDPEEAKRAGRKGGNKISKNRRHMADIGRKGGRTTARKLGYTYNDDKPLKSDDT